MTVDDVIYHWGDSVTQMAHDLKVTRQTITNWRKAGAIPDLQAIRIKYEIIPVVIRRAEIKEKHAKALDAALEKEAKL